MTAPLPPHDDIDPNGKHLYRASTVKLAVREALLRLLDQKTYEFTPSRIRAMIEEYK